MERLRLDGHSMWFGYSVRFNIGIRLNSHLNMATLDSFGILSEHLPLRYEATAGMPRANDTHPPVVTLDRFPSNFQPYGCDPSSKVTRPGFPPPSPPLGLVVDGLMSVKRESCRKTLSRSSLLHSELRWMKFVPTAVGADGLK